MKRYSRLIFDAVADGRGSVAGLFDAKCRRGTRGYRPAGEGATGGSRSLENRFCNE